MEDYLNLIGRDSNG